MKDSIMELLHKLLVLDTSAGNDVEQSKSLSIIDEELESFGKKDFLYNGVRSSIYFNGEILPEKFDVIFNCHLDIIPANKKQFIPKIENGNLYAAGALDMKGNLVCATLAFKNFSKKSQKNIGIQFVTDEEIGGYNGTKYQVDCGIQSHFIISTEPTNFDIVYKAKGVYQFEVTTTGITAHSAYPWSGSNAIEIMLEFLKNFTLRFQNPTSNKWETSYNISSINTLNSAYNKIPDMCSVKIDIRFVPDHEKTIKQVIQDILLVNCSLKEYAFEPCFQTDKHNENIIELQKLVEKYSTYKSKLYGANGTSDGRHFKKNAIEFGAIGAGIGSDDEYVSIESLEKYYSILVDFIKI